MESHIKRNLLIGIALLVAGIAIASFWFLSGALGLVVPSELRSTIPKIVGSVVALAGMVFVCLSLFAEFRERRRARTAELLRRSLADLRRDLDILALPIEIGEPRDPEGRNQLLSGRDAIEAFARAVEEAEHHDYLVGSPFFHDLHLVVQGFDTLRTRIEKADLSNPERRHLISRLSFLYSSRLIVAVAAIGGLSAAAKLRISVKYGEKTPAQLLAMMLQVHQEMERFILRHQA